MKKVYFSKFLKLFFIFLTLNCFIFLFIFRQLSLILPLCKKSFFPFPSVVLKIFSSWLLAVLPHNACFYICSIPLFFTFFSGPISCIFNELIIEKLQMLFIVAFYKTEAYFCQAYFILSPFLWKSSNLKVLERC